MRIGLLVAVEVGPTVGKWRADRNARVRGSDGLGRNFVVRMESATLDPWQQRASIGLRRGDMSKRSGHRRCLVGGGVVVVVAALLADPF